MAVVTKEEEEEAAAAAAVTLACEVANVEAEESECYDADVGVCLNDAGGLDVDEYNIYDDVLAGL
jgi:hypothetical protein